MSPLALEYVANVYMTDGHIEADTGATEHIEGFKELAAELARKNELLNELIAQAAVTSSPPEAKIPENACVSIKNRIAVFLFFAILGCCPGYLLLDKLLDAIKLPPQTQAQPSEPTPEANSTDIPLTTAQDDNTSSTTTNPFPLAPSTFEIVPTATAASYIVKIDDTLGEIAMNCGVTLSEIAFYNHIPDPYLIYEGQSIGYPRDCRPPDALRNTPYVVQDGDTLTKIASMFGVSVEDILAANLQIKDPNIIRIGDVLIIP